VTYGQSIGPIISKPGFPQLTNVHLDNPGSSHHSSRTQKHNSWPVTIQSPRTSKSGKVYHHGAHTAFGGILTEDEQKFCGCVLDVESNVLSGSSNVSNPAAVCAHSVKTTSRYCEGNVDWEMLDEDRLRAALSLHGMDTTGNRDQLLARVHTIKPNVPGPHSRHYGEF